MKKIALLLIFITVNSLNGFSQEAAGLYKTKTKNTDAKKVRISGIVISKTANELLPNAIVSVKRYSTNPIEFRDAPNNIIKTNANGRWELKEIEAGKYRIVISPPEKKGNQTGSLASLAKVTKIVDANDDLENLTVKLPNEAVIIGTIRVKNNTDDAGEVYIIATDTEQEIVSGTEIKNKNFKLENLSEGSYKLDLHSEKGYFVESIRLNDNDIANSAIELKDGQTLQNITIVLSKESGFLMGKVNGLTGQNKVMVILLPVKDKAEESLRGSIPEFPDENGKFKFTASPGEYLVATFKVADMDKQTENKKVWFEFITKNAQKVIISPTQTTNVELFLPN